MRALGILALFAGCSADVEPIAIAHRSTLQERTVGVALSDDGETGQAAMFGTTCDFRTRSAVLDTDYDFPGTEEEVQDGGDDPVVGFATVTVSHMGFHVTLPHQGDAWDVPVAGGVVHGRRVDGGVSVIHETPTGCAGRWHALDALRSGPRVDLPDEACASDADVSVDPAAGDLFVTTPDGVLVLTDTGWTRIDVRAELLSWDPWAGVLYAAMRGRSEVRAHDLDGSLRWRAEVEGGVTDLSHLGEQAAAVVTTALPDGTGSIVVLDASSGDTRLAEPTPAPAAALVAAARGEVLAVVLPDEVHFYDVSVP